MRLGAVRFDRAEEGLDHDGEGTEFIAILRGANPSVKVLVLTVSIEPGLQGRMAEAGADGVLDKTAALSEIASEVARLGRGG